MELKRITLAVSTAITQAVEKKAYSIISDFSRAVSLGINPPDVISAYTQQFKELNKQWQICVKHNLRYGRKQKSIFVDSCNHYCLADYIKEHYNFTIHHGQNFQRIYYTREKFFDLAKMEIALLLAKYTEIYKFEVEVAIVQTLFHYFEIYSQRGWDNTFIWSIPKDDLTSIIYDIFQTDMSEFKVYADLIGNFTPTLSVQQSVTYRKPKPTSKEDIADCIEDGMTQSQIAESIMDNWDVSRATAYRLMKQYGYISEHHRQTVASDEVARNDSEDVQQLKDIISQQQAEIEQLKTEIKRLTETPEAPQPSIEIDEPTDTDEETEQAMWLKSVMGTFEIDKLRLQKQSDK